MVTLIKIIYTLNGNDSSLSFDPSNKLKVFKNIVNLTQKVKVDLYDIFYKNKIISAMDEMEVKRIIGTDSSPVFHIEKKGVSPKETSSAKVSQMPKKNKYKYKVLVQNYPSRTEINSLIHSFLDVNFIQDNYVIENKQHSIEVLFGVRVKIIINTELLRELNKIHK